MCELHYELARPILWEYITSIWYLIDSLIACQRRWFHYLSLSYSDPLVLHGTVNRKGKKHSKSPESYQWITKNPLTAKSDARHRSAHSRSARSPGQQIHIRRIQGNSIICRQRYTQIGGLPHDAADFLCWDVVMLSQSARSDRKFDPRKV
jgi:hypothetical protein